MTRIEKVLIVPFMELKHSQHPLHVSVRLS